jgi:methylenetetrahydrofolate reductase (NADPH)
VGWQSYMSFKRMTGFCKTLVPRSVWDDLAPIKDDDEAVKNFGINYATKICR